MRRHKKKKLCEIMGFGVSFKKSVLRKGSLPKSYLLIVIPSRNIKDESLILPHVDPSNFELVLN